MKFKILLCFILFFLSVTLQASENIIFNSWGSEDGTYFQNQISIATLSKMPSWNPEDGMPPLSQLEAIKKAKAFIAQTYPQFTGYQISEVKLVQFLIPAFFKNKWHYSIIFMNNIPVTHKIPEHINVVVMLDGSINVPVKKKL